MAIETGKYISLDLSEYVKRWVSNTELKEIAKDNDLSYELARLISSRDRKITQENHPLFIDILKRAIHNRKKILPKLESTNRIVLKIIKELAA